MEDKDFLRQRLKALRDGMAPDERHRLSQAICRSALNLEVIRRCKRIALYASCQSEVDTRGLFVGLRDRGAEVLYPRVACQPRHGARLAFARVDHLEELDRGAFDIDEPRGPAVDLSKADAVVVPGIGFDRWGGRLGHGAGYYDHALVHYDRTCIGLAFGCQVIDRIPVAAHDRLMDVLITEEGAITTAAGAQRSGAVLP